MPETGTAVHVCGICKAPMEGVVKMRLSVHKECRRMQDRGLLSTGAPSPMRDSTGSRCCGCNTTIEAGAKHAHRNGRPFHRECLL